MSNKYNIGGHNIFNEKTGSSVESSNFFRGVVVSNIDPTDGGRITVRIKGLDDHLEDIDLSYVSPMLPKFFQVTPKKDEVVFVLVPNRNNVYLDRMYFGPLISQPQMLFKDTFVNGATSGLDTGFMQPRIAPSTIPENKGVYADKEDIAIQGRNNSDIIFKAKEVLLRAGQFNLDTKVGDIPKFNTSNPAYIQIKSDVTIGKNNDVIEKGSVVNMVANKINLLTHKGGSPRFILNNQDSMISETELAKILEEAHPMVFGDNLIDFLKLQRAAFSYHVHPYHGITAEDLAGRDDIDKYLSYDLDSIVTKNIMIN